MCYSVQPSSQAAIDASPEIMKWIGDGETDDENEGENETASTISGSKNSATTAFNPFYNPSLHFRPVEPGVDSSMISQEVAEAIYGPFARSNDYAGPSALPQVNSDEVRMDLDDRFDDDVMIYYHAALLSTGTDPDFDTVPTAYTQMPPPTPIEFDLDYNVLQMEDLAEAFAMARARGTLEVEDDLECFSNAVLKMGMDAENAFLPQMEYEDTTFDVVPVQPTESGAEDFMDVVPGQLAESGVDDFMSFPY